MPGTPSVMVLLGTIMPEFSLPDYNGAVVKSSSYEGRPLLVVFICNHCPMVKHVIDSLGAKAKEYEALGVSVVGIAPNDIAVHPEDDPAHMKVFAAEHGLGFPYLYDELQEVAKAFGAACTPDFFLFDRAHRLAYRGQYDDSRPGNGLQVTGSDLAAAVQGLVRGEAPVADQKPAFGCGIKWRQGNEPKQFSSLRL